MKTIIVSLGQLISSDISQFKASFQNSFLNRQLKFTGEDAWNWLLPHLPELRLAKINLNDLLGDFNSKFSTTLSFDEFRKNFNSMSQMNSDSLTRMKVLVDFLQSHPDVQILVVSHSNWSHFEFIMEQLDEILPYCRAGLIENDQAIPKGQILFAPSMTSQCEKHPDTLDWAIKRLKIDLNDPLISLLNTVQAVEGAEQFKYTPVGPNLRMEDFVNAATVFSSTSPRPN
ncbi:hypothetical protein Lbir_2919 [Legionella birminghamensis]|uniref:Uncharacterized protein n=1 Tax=Legionella birminghamensis TaxID=28083 RepID=A0A378I8C0_9GAMM|nr:hypothetical protein [Legionella birminghamensis]KTC68317.1 hypothetical protein Lbir_2919 [Legionella birminghamensis]STX30970.1 Uncharacterised protein [Legionella birminghamensis]